MDDLLMILARRYRKLRVKPLAKPLGRAYRWYASRRTTQRVIATVDDITYELDLNEAIDWNIYYYGCFEALTTAVLRRLCRPGFTVLDIGANIGCHTMPLARMVGPDGKVVAFEPTAWAFRKLERNLELNTFSNVKLERMALSSQVDERSVMRLRSSWPLDGMVDGEANAYDGGSERDEAVRCDTVDEYLNRTGIDRVDLIKMDVDGYEHRVVRGSLRTLQRHKPILVVELGRYTLEALGDTLDALVGELDRLEYRFFSERDLSPFPDVRAVLDAVPPDRTINVVASTRPLDSPKGDHFTGS